MTTFDQMVHKPFYPAEFPTYVPYHSLDHSSLIRIELGYFLWKSPKIGPNLGEFVKEFELNKFHNVELGMKIIYSSGKGKITQSI